MIFENLENIQNLRIFDDDEIIAMMIDGIMVMIVITTRILVEMMVMMEMMVIIRRNFRNIVILWNLRKILLLEIDLDSKKTRTFSPDF